MSTPVPRTARRPQPPQLRADAVIEPGAAPSSARFPLVTAVPARWTEAVAAVAAAGAVATGATRLAPGWAGLTWLVVLAAVAGTVGVGVLGWRANRRRRILADLSNRVGYLLKTSVRASSARWSRGLVGDPIRVCLDSSDQATIGYGDRLAAQLAQATSGALGATFQVTRHDQRRGRTTLRAVSVQREKPTALELAQQRVRDVVVETFGADATVDAFKTAPTSEDSVTGFTVHYKAAASKLTVPAIRRRITNAVGDRLDGRWKADFALQDDRVTYSRRPPLPTFYARPTDPVPARADPAYNLIPQAVDEDGEVLNWDISGVMAHLLRCGKTRSGKTVSLIGDAIEMARRGFRVLVLDPKRTEFLGLRDWPNVELVATRIPDQVALVHQLWLEMEDRYRRIEEEGADEADFDPILLIIDEYRQMHANVKAWWSGIKVTGMPGECPVFEEIGSLLRMAAACRIHVDLATQRPDAEFLKGEALALDTPIPTPTGWTTMAELQIGQLVFDENGRSVRVVDTKPVRHGRPCYRVTFSDGTAIVADEDHLWAAKDASRRETTASAYETLPRSQRYPEHADLLHRLDLLQADDKPVKVSDLEAELGPGRTPLLRRCLNENRWSLEPSASEPSRNGRFPTRLYSRAALIDNLRAELTSPVRTGRQEGPRIVTTKTIGASVSTTSGHNWSVDTIPGLDLPELALPIDPWLLGYWLGDGCRRAATIATADEEILERIRHLGYRVTHYARYNYGISTGPRGGGSRPSLQRALRECGLLFDKHIPATYLRASDAQRAELLAGLLDSDGTCSVRGHGARLSAQVVFTNTNPRLIDGVRELAASLGHLPTVCKIREAGVEQSTSSVASGRRIKEAWAVRFTPDGQVFGLRRKQELLERTLKTRTRTRANRRPRYVVSVEAVPSVPVRCITVDSPTHLYLVGTGFVATHNCRDNFAARAAAGRLSPDGAQMMFDSQHIGVAIPLNVRGRGTMTGMDDRPREVQFLYTPDPRRARTPEDLALLDALRPSTTRWPRKVIELPPAAEVAEALDGKKTSVEWEQVLRSFLVPFDTTATQGDADVPPALIGGDGAARRGADRVDRRAHQRDDGNDVGERDDVDDQGGEDEGGDEVYEGYDEPTLVRVETVEVGDLIRLHERGPWVCVELVDQIGPAYGGQVQLDWRDDDDNAGEQLISTGELAEVRRPLD